MRDSERTGGFPRLATLAQALLKSAKFMDYLALNTQICSRYLMDVIKSFSNIG